MIDNKPLSCLEYNDLQELFCPTESSDNAPCSHTVNKFKKGEYIFQPDEDADKFYFIMNGKVKIGIYNDAGKEITKAILSSGEIFGELALIDLKSRRDFALSMETTIVCVTSINTMKSLIRDRKELSVFLMKTMGARMLKMEQRLESLVFKDSRTRIVEFLKELADKKGQRVGYEILVRNFMTHQEIANLTATSRQTVTTVLNDLRSRKILTFNRKRLLVRDMELLAKETTLE